MQSNSTPCCRSGKPVSQHHSGALLLCLIAGPLLAVAPAAAQANIGRGCTTAFYIDHDCDGYGVGKKSSGVYIVGANGEVNGHPLIETTGDMPDADDEDPTVHTADEWRAKWGSDNDGMVNFLAQRKGFV